MGVTSDFPKIETGELRATVSEGDDGKPSLALRLEGSAEAGAGAALARLFEAVHVAASRGEVREVSVDLRGLEFMNASCFKALVGWVGKVEGLEAPRQYGIRFISDPEKRWQGRSLETLTCFATHLIRVEG